MNNDAEEQLRNGIAYRREKQKLARQTMQRTLEALKAKTLSSRDAVELKLQLPKSTVQYLAFDALIQLDMAPQASALAEGQYKGWNRGRVREQIMANLRAMIEESVSRDICETFGHDPEEFPRFEEDEQKPPSGRQRPGNSDDDVVV